MSYCDEAVRKTINSKEFQEMLKSLRAKGKKVEKPDSDQTQTAQKKQKRKSNNGK